jgi:hypothetical protein
VEETGRNPQTVETTPNSGKNNGRNTIKHVKLLYMINSHRHYNCSFARLWTPVQVVSIVLG